MNVVKIIRRVYGAKGRQKNVRRNKWSSSSSSSSSSYTPPGVFPWCQYLNSPAIKRPFPNFRGMSHDEATQQILPLDWAQVYTIPLTSSLLFLTKLFAYTITVTSHSNARQLLSKCKSHFPDKWKIIRSGNVKISVQIYALWRVM
jgi:hypothetical protein